MVPAVAPRPHPPALRRVLHLLLFLAVVTVSLGGPLLRRSLSFKIALGLLLLIPAAYLYLAQIRLFVPAVFFAINAITGPFTIALLGRLPFQFPQLSFLPAIVLYLAVTLPVPSLRRHLHWLRAGKLERRTTGLIAILVVASAVALVAWSFLIASDFSRFRQFVPSVSLPALILYGVAFAAANSCFEEFIARAVLFDGFAALSSGVVTAIVAQAALFALWHFGGFPGGAIGVGMVFVWSLLLGTIRHISGGMLAPLIAHFFADATIALILLFALRLA